MKINVVRLLGIGVVAVVLVVAVTGCGEKSESPGVGERTGAALDKAAAKTAIMATNVAEKTSEAGKNTAAATKDVTGQVLEKTGDALEKGGAAAEKTGTDMQK